MTIPPLGLAQLAVLEVPPADLIPMARRAGYAATGLRVHPAAPGMAAYPLRTASEQAEIRRILDGEGMRIAEVEIVGLTGDMQAADYEWMMEVGAAIGATSMTVAGDDRDFGKLADVFGAFCDAAARHGMWIDLEFMRWRAVATLQDALAIVTRAGRPNGHILIDALHLYRAGGAAHEVARIDPKHIRTLQLCDAPRELPQGLSYVDEARGLRLLPGEGALPLHGLMNALPANCAVAVEVPMGLSRPELGPYDRIRLARDATVRFLEGRVTS